MDLDVSGLDGRIFSAFAETSERRYMYLINLRTAVSRWSKSAVEYFDLPGEYILHVGKIWENLIHPDDREKYHSAISAVFHGRATEYEMEYRIRNRQGDYVICSCKGQRLFGENGEPDMLAGTVTNHGIMDSVDAVTHLHNMYAFLRDMRKPADVRHTDMVMMVAINQFQAINDVYSYQMGNCVLRSLAQALTDFVHDHSRVYRLDGPKFALCFQNVDREQAESYYAQLQELARTRICVEDKCIPLSISGGAVFLGDKSAGEFSVRACLAYAQECSKRERHSELVFFNSNDKKNDLQSLELIETVRESVFEGCKGFFLCYQPLVRSSDNKIIGMEALVRWKQDPYGVVGPNRFIPWLEQDECFFELGNWILRQGMLDAKKIVDKDPDFIVNINVSYTQLSRRDFTATLLNILRETGFPPKNLCLELTERCRALDENQLREMLTQFRAHDIRIALDDFGTGSAALTLLRTLPITSLKLDRTFIADIQSNATTGVLVNFIVDSAHKLGLGVCVEGIEDRPLRDYVKQYNVNYFQGYYYSRPVQFEDFVRLLPGETAC